VIEAERPQLIVLSGDTISGAFWDGRQGWAEARCAALRTYNTVARQAPAKSKQQTHKTKPTVQSPFDHHAASHTTAATTTAHHDPKPTSRVWRPLAALLARLGTPYALILGNHCAEADLGRRQIVEMAARLGGPLSLTRAGPLNVSGATNYWLDVLPSGGGGGGGNTSGGGGGGGAVAARVWLLDSNRRGCEGVRGWGCVGRDAVRWVRRRAGALPRAAAGVAYVHIPPPGGCCVLCVLCAVWSVAGWPWLVWMLCFGGGGVLGQ